MNYHDNKLMPMYPAGDDPAAWRPRKFLLITALLLLSGLVVLGADVSVNGPLTYEKEAAIGETYSGSIELANNEDKPQEVKVYQTDYLFYADGRVLYGEPGKTPRSNASWITVTPARLTIPPGEKSVVHFTVKVPGDKKMEGTYWSLLMVEGIPETSPESSSADPTTINLGITQVLRFGCQLVTHIGKTGIPAVKFLATRLLKKDQQQTFELDAENSGTRWLRTTMWLEIYDLSGTFIGKFEGSSFRIYPATSVRYRIDLSKVPNGTYKALAVIDGGGKDIFGANFNLIIK